MSNRCFLPLIAAVALASVGLQYRASAQSVAPESSVSEASVQPKITVETRCIKISEANMKSLDIRPVSVPGDSGPFRRGALSNQGLEQVEALLKQKKAKVLTAPRISAVNQQPTELRQYTQTPSPLAIQYFEGKYVDVFEKVYTRPSGQQTLLSFSSGLGMNVTPSLNADNTVNLVYNPGARTQLAEGDRVLLQRDLLANQNLNNIHPGETVALMGAKTSILSAYDRAKSENMLILVKVTLDDTLK